MDTLKTLSKNLDELKIEVEELEEFQDTYKKIIPEIEVMIKELFEKPSLKTLPTKLTL